MIEKTAEGWKGKAQVDASDRREVVLPDNSRVTTTCLLKGEFDILAINVFAFELGFPPYDKLFSFSAMNTILVAVR